MKDERKTEAQLVSELVGLRQRVAELEATGDKLKQAGTVLQESEMRYRRLFDSTPDSVTVVDATGVIVECNPSGALLYGHPREEMVGKHITELMHPSSVAVFQENFPRLRQLEPVEGKIKIIKSDGSTVEIWRKGIPLTDDDGNFAGALVHDRDITEHKRSEEALRRVGLELAAQMDLGELLHSIVSRAIELMQGTNGGLYIHRPEQDVLEWAVAIGPNITPVGTVLRRGIGLAGKVWETGETIIVDDYRHWDERAAAYSDHPFTAIVGVPVRWGDEFLGVLNVHADSPRTFSASDAKLLSLFATQAAIALRNARLYEQAQQEIVERKRAEEKIRQRSQDLTLINLMNNAANQGDSLQEIIQLLVKETKRTFSSNGATVYFLSKDGKHLAMQNLAIPPAMVSQVKSSSVREYRR